MIANNEIYLQHVIGVIADSVGRDPETILPNTSLQDELELDSTELVGIIVDVEKIVGVSLKAVKYSGLKTPADLASEIARIANSDLAA